jgi:hypothetical protein
MIKYYFINLNKYNYLVIDKNLIKNLKNGRAERKARSRGVSGCSIKKDGIFKRQLYYYCTLQMCKFTGNRFEYGLDCIDLAYENNYSEKSSSDSEGDYDEYADYVCKYSDEEIRQIVGDYLENGNMMEETLVCYYLHNLRLRLINFIFIFTGFSREVCHYQRYCQPHGQGSHFGYFGKYSRQFQFCGQSNSRDDCEEMGSINSHSRDFGGYRWLRRGIIQRHTKNGGISGNFHGQIG